MLSALGCSQQSRKNFAWPWTPEVDDAVGITTPAKRLADMTAMAANADKQTPAEQERVSGDLAKQIQEEQDPMIRRYIVLTLGHYKTASATAVLGAAISDTDTSVRIAACDAWGRRGGPEAAERLTGLLASDTNLDVRLAAARGIGQTHEKSALAPLAEALSDADPAIQYCVVGALKQISGKDYGTDVNLWRAYARGENPSPPEGPSIAQRLRNLF
jgi:HEAT repeat protein